MKKKSINDLFAQYSSIGYKKGRVLTIYFAYLRAFEYRFGFAPHTNACKLFVEKYGKDHKM